MTGAMKNKACPVCLAAHDFTAGGERIISGVAALHIISRADILQIFVPSIS